jgi:hypothetical protein
MRVIKQLLLGLLHMVRLIIGFGIYVVRRRTPQFSYQSMINLFCLTGGRSNDLLSRAIGVFKRSYRFTAQNGILGEMTEESRKKITSILREQGYYVFENRLPEALCDRLLQFSISQPCKMRPMDGDSLGKPIVTTYHRDSPRAVRYDFDTQDLLDNKDVQHILADMSFAAVAQDYVGAKPVIDIVTMWWHTNFSDKPDMEAAQYYHFDMDRPKWLKFFIYLTDVEPMNGPHSFVAGSHKTGAIPSRLLKKGYARLSDDEVAREFDEKNFIEFSAPRGTIIAEDTRGLHKGKHVEKDDRLVFQIEFCNSLFGGDCPKAFMSNDLTEDLKIKVRQFPELYSAYRAS